MHLVSFFLFVALLESTICLNLPEQVTNENVAVVLLHTEGETRACAGFPVANQWVISSSSCVTDRWKGHTKILAGKSQLSKYVFNDANNVSGIFHYPPPRTPGGGNYSLKLFSFAPGYNRTNDVKLSNATSWADVGNESCSVWGLDGNGSVVSAVLSADNASQCWKDADACFEEASGAVVVCGGSAVAIAAPPQGGGHKRTLEFLGRYKKWVDELTTKLFSQREGPVLSDDDCDVPFLMESQDRCASSCTLSSLMLVLGAIFFVAM